MLTAKLDFDKDFPKLENVPLTENANYDVRIRQFNRWFIKKKLNGESLILPKHIREFFLEMEKRKRSTTVKAYANSLRAAYRIQSTDKFELTLIIEFFRSLKIIEPEKRVRLDRILNDSELLRLQESSKLPESAKLMIRLCVENGLRRSELCSIQVRDCLPSPQGVTIRILGKRQKERRIKIPIDLYESIRKEFNGKFWLFETRNGTSIHPNQFYNWMLKAGKILDKRISPHDLRHTFATRLLKKGASLKAISKYLGHSTTEVTADNYVQDELDVLNYWESDT